MIDTPASNAYRVISQKINDEQDVIKKSQLALQASDIAWERTEEIREEILSAINAVNETLKTQGVSAKRVDDLRDEMATRFNALADEVDSLKGDKQPQDEKEPLDPVILGIAQAYRSMDGDRIKGDVGYKLREAYRGRLSTYGMKTDNVHSALMSYGLDADA